MKKGYLAVLGLISLLLAACGPSTTDRGNQSLGEVLDEEIPELEPIPASPYAEFWVSGIPGKGQLHFLIQNAFTETPQEDWITYEAEDLLNYFHMDFAPDMMSSKSWEEIPVDFNFKVENPQGSEYPRFDYSCSQDQDWTDDVSNSQSIINVNPPTFSGTLVCTEMWTNEEFVAGVRGDFKRAEKR